MLQSSTSAIALYIYIYRERERETERERKRERERERYKGKNRGTNVDRNFLLYIKLVNPGRFSGFGHHQKFLFHDFFSVSRLRAYDIPQEYIYIYIYIYEDH